MTVFSIWRSAFTVTAFTAALAFFTVLAGNGRVMAQEDDDGYGYYEVTGVGALNIRERPYLTSPVLAVADEGEILVKWKRFCSLRPWCPVQKGDVQGWAGKAYLTEVEPE
jgi:hypothetical protein